MKPGPSSPQPRRQTPLHARVRALAAAGMLGLLAAGAESGPARGAEGSVPVPGDGVPSVGMEGILRTNLPGTLLTTRPVLPRTPLLVRVAEARPHGNLIAYDLRYVGLEPGRHDLRAELVRVDGSPTTDLPPLPVEVRSVLPPRHDGILDPTASTPWARLGGYRVVLVMAGALWLLCLIPLVLRLRPKPVAESRPAPAPPTLAERMRPLVEAAAAGRLDAGGQAELERLLLGHWRETLGLGGAGMAESMATLRAHPEAGRLLASLEAWLHQPPGRARVDVEALLAPYRGPAGTPAGGGPGGVVS